jgi:glycerol-3-phosphate acyltransferase PlsX
MSSRKLRIAIDSMGGDYAPSHIVHGAVIAAAEPNVEIQLVGPESTLSTELSKYDISELPITQIHAGDYVIEGESPAFAVYRKMNASINIAMNQIHTGKADVVISAGPTGAVAASAMKTLGLMPGIKRPVLCVPLVGLAPHTILVDGGANIDCKAQHLLSFAVIGSIYAKKLLNVNNPTVALLSVGIEEGKGTKTMKEAYSLLQQNSSLNFVGNIEGYDILAQKANVIVCDGIIGNVLMKFYESLGYYFDKWLRRQIGNVPIASSVVGLLDQIRLFSRLTSNERDGGGLLWGVKGIVHLLHGNSQSKQIVQAVSRSIKFADLDLIAYLDSELTTINTSTVTQPSPENQLQRTI